MANSNDSLDTLNSNINFDLKNALEIFFGDDNEENSFINDNHSHLYFDLDTFANKFTNNSIIFLSINVCSLMSKHQNLSLAINDMLKKQVKIKVIAVQETWNVPYPELVNINGFKLFIKTRTNNRGGGIAFYVKDDITCKINHNLSPFYEKEFECLTVEIVLNKKKLQLLGTGTDFLVFFMFFPQIFPFWIHSPDPITGGYGTTSHPLPLRDWPLYWSHHSWVRYRYRTTSLPLLQ